MARPRKNNADYFSHDNDMRKDAKILALRSKFGNEGYAVWNMLLEVLSECDGFKLALQKEIEWVLTSSDFCVEIKTFKNIVNFCIFLGLLKRKQNFIFCPKLVERLSPLLEKREKMRVSDAEMPVSDAETPVSDAEMPHSKVKERKEEYSNSNELPRVPSDELVYEPLVGNKTKGAFLDRARAKKGKPPMLKKDPATWAIISLYRRQYRYIRGKEPYIGDPDYFHVLSITKKMSPQDMEAMVLWYVKEENKKFKQHPSLKSIFTVENLNLFNNEK